MTVLYLLAPALAFVVLGAHFYRAAIYLPIWVLVALMALCVLMVALLFVRRPWAARTIQAALVSGAIVWLWTTVSQIVARQQIGAPYVRLAVILGVVTLLTALCALIVETRRLKRHFRLVSRASPSGTSG